MLIPGRPYIFCDLPYAAFLIIIITTEYKVPYPHFQQATTGSLLQRRTHF